MSARRPPRPHHRPTSSAFAEPHVTVDRRDVDDPTAWRRLVATLADMVDSTPPRRDAGGQ